jgi:hypothetical protein
MITKILIFASAMACSATAFAQAPVTCASPTGCTNGIPNFLRPPTVTQQYVGGGNTATTYTDPNTGLSSTTMGRDPNYGGDRNRGVVPTGSRPPGGNAPRPQREYSSPPQDPPRPRSSAPIPRGRGR